MEHEETIHLRLLSELHSMCIHKETNRYTNINTYILPHIQGHRKVICIICSLAYNPTSLEAEAVGS